MVAEVNKLISNTLCQGRDLYLPEVGALVVRRNAASRAGSTKMAPPCRTVTFTGESKICVNVAGGVDILLNVLIRKDGRTAGDGADQRNFAYFRHGNNIGGNSVSNREKIVRLNIQCPTKVFNSFWIGHVLIIFPVAYRIVLGVYFCS